VGLGVVELRSMKEAAQWIKADLHIHSTGSDGRGTPEEVVRTAVEKGIGIVAIAEHVWNVKLSQINQAQQSFERAADYAAKTNLPVIIVPAFELTTINWHVVLAGVDFPKMRRYFESQRQPARLDNLLGMAEENGLVTIAAHPALRYWKWHLPTSMPLALMKKHIDRFSFVEADNGGALWALRREKYEEWHNRVTRFVAETGGKTIASSDAHELEHIGIVHSEIPLPRGIKVSTATETIELLRQPEITVRRVVDHEERNRLKDGGPSGFWSRVKQRMYEVAN
jgi:histidinol phosphatase-like PHP family hydrolase